MIPESVRNIKISDFDFAFDENLIAQKPLEKRDESNLLHFANGKIQHKIFKDFPDIINSNSQLILNNAKVIPARLNFFRKSGAKIEVLLLEPLDAVEKSLISFQTTTWKCMIGNLKKWGIDETIFSKIGNIILEAKLISYENQVVEFLWNNDIPFSEILQKIGSTPLPPYIKRQVDEKDKETYQTVFAKNPGAIAAPTAGLHFTENIFEKLIKKNIDVAEVTLYVSAGTFAPVKVQNPIDHNMHAELFSVSKKTLQSFINQKYRIAVGTTSLRTLESLYWIGVKLSKNEPDSTTIEKLYPYFYKKLPIKWEESIYEIINFLDKTSSDTLNAKTEIMIMPGYNFTSVKGLLTNFHYPNTTLVMLVAAFAGNDWQKIYNEAINNNYRFMSYGDCCFLEN